MLAANRSWSRIKLLRRFHQFFRMALRPPPIASRSVPFLKLVREYLVVSKDVGTAPQNRVAFTPFYWKSACFEACAGAFELHFELVRSAS